MDWQELEVSADAILNMAVRHGEAMLDANSLLHNTFANHQKWLIDPSTHRLAYQALDALEIIGLLRRPDGHHLTATDAGRAVSASGSRVSLSTIPALRDWAEIEDLSEAVAKRAPGGSRRFAHLDIEDWRQFGRVSLSFHPRLTILTGANATGKTTLLSVLSPHFNWNAQLLSHKRVDPDSTPILRSFGSLRYSDGSRTPLVENVGFGLNAAVPAMPQQQVVAGIYISSHRSISSYQPLQHIPSRFSASQTLLQEFSSDLQARHFGHNSQYPPLHRMKEALVSAALHGYGNRAVRRNTEALEVWEGFQQVLHRVMPETLRFRRLAVEDGEILISTSTSEFPLEAASGGLSAMLELSWQVFLRGRESEAFTVCIDEPENHLHPELQRSLVPALLDGFPKASFVLATHSPFVVTATRDCLVYALRATSGGNVETRRVADLNQGGTPDDTLMSVLGLDTPLPIWAETAIEQALAKVPADPSAVDLRQLRIELAEIGLDRQFPAAVEALQNRPDS